MMDWTDRYCRSFHRILSRRARLYTEMVTADAVIHGDRERLLGFDPPEHPIALQLGGCDPHKLFLAARLGAQCGYDEINLNAGCPSDRVQSGRFGACLMAEPTLVRECLAAMRDGAEIVPVTLKCRIGIDDQKVEETLPRFIEEVSKSGITTIIVHARKAWLEGLSPKENRSVPPLDYRLVFKMKAEFTSLNFVLNGGIDSMVVVPTHLAHVDGVMMGRAAYQNPAILLDVDRDVFGEVAPRRTRRDAVEEFLPVIERKLNSGVPLHAITRHMLGLFNGLPRARTWRRILTEGARGPGARIDVVKQALEAVCAARSAEPALEMSHV